MQFLVVGAVPAAKVARMSGLGAHVHELFPGMPRTEIWTSGAQVSQKKWDLKKTNPTSEN